jgi:ankyrin repeat protein
LKGAWFQRSNVDYESEKLVSKFAFSNSLYRYVAVLNLTVYSYALGEVSAAVMKQDEDMVKQRQNILAVESYIQTRTLPEDLSGQIRAHFDFLAESAAISSSEVEGGGAQDIFAQLSHSLQVEVSSYLSRDLIASCIAFRDSDDIFLDSMAVLLREVNMSSDQYLYRVNEVSRELFIISAGIVELTVENVVEGGDNVISIRQRGELCGELSFFFGIRQNTNARTSSTSTASFFCLPKEDYLQLLKLYPQEEENLTRNALAAFDDFSSGKDGQSSYASSTYSSEQGGSKTAGSAQGSEASSTALASNVDTNALDDIATVRKVLNVARQKKLNEKIVSLVTAAAKNDISEVSRMLGQGDINVDMGDYDERTPLHLAASNGHTKMVKHLVQIHGADLSVKDRYGGTPMVDAIRHKHDGCAAFLRSQGASLEVDDAAEQLCSAAAKNDVAALRRLVENHVDPNLADYDKRTAMHLAASEGKMDALRFLIKIKGIELSPEDRLGGTPLADAIRHKRPEAQKLLREHGANLGNMDVSVRLCEAGAQNDLRAQRRRPQLRGLRPAHRAAPGGEHGAPRGDELDPRQRRRGPCTSSIQL